MIVMFKALFTARLIFTENSKTSVLSLSRSLHMLGAQGLRKLTELISVTKIVNGNPEM